MTTQLALPLALPRSTTDFRKTPEQQQAFQRLLERTRKETTEILAMAEGRSETIANQLHSTSWLKLAQVPTAELRPAATEYRRRHGIVVAQAQHGPINRKPERPYRPWTLERKHRDRIRRLWTRVQKRYSIVELQHEHLQAELCRLPQYFGICVLPGAAQSCALNLIDLLPNKAKEREAELRKKEPSCVKKYFVSGILQRMCCATWQRK